MNWFRRLGQRASGRKEDDGASEHLAEFMKTRKGVEAWLERPTNFNKASLLLVAADGETTRRAVPSREFAQQLCAVEDVPCYDAGVVPYPQRMRDYGVNKKKDGGGGGSW